MKSPQDKGGLLGTGGVVGGKGGGGGGVVMRLTCMPSEDVLSHGVGMMYYLTSSPQPSLTLLATSASLSLVLSLRTSHLPSQLATVLSLTHAHTHTYTHTHTRTLKKKSLFLFIVLVLRWMFPYLVCGVLGEKYIV